MKARIVPEQNWEMLPREIVEEIILAAAKDYGVKFISRETGDEYIDDGVLGLFLPAIKKALNSADT